MNVEEDCGESVEIASSLAKFDCKGDRTVYIADHALTNPLLERSAGQVRVAEMVSES